MTVTKHINAPCTIDSTQNYDRCLRLQVNVVEKQFLKCSVLNFETKLLNFETKLPHS